MTFVQQTLADGSLAWIGEDGREYHPQNYLVREWVASGAETPVLPYVAPPPTVEPPKVYSKLKLRRNLRAAGLEPALDAYLSGHPTAKVDWDDATELAADDQLLQSAIPDLCSAAGVTEQQADALLAASVRD